MCTSQKISKMKKYIITSADGKRRLTQTTYASREEAGDALMYYIDTNNAGYPKGDANYLNPFDFTFNEKWIDEDFNPSGLRVGFLDDDGFISTEWDEDCDCYCTTYEEGDDVDAYGRKKPNMPTHWMKMPTHP